MKKRILLLFISLLILVTNIFPNRYGEDYTLTVDKQYMGIYFPDEFIYELEVNHNFEEAKLCVPEGSLPHVWLQEDLCRSATLQYSEVSIMDKEEFKTLQFYKEGNDAFVKDKNGFIYKRVTTDSSYEGFLSYLAYHSFYALKDLKNVELEGSNLIIDGKKYQFVEETNWVNTDDILCQVGGMGLKTNGMSGGLFPMEQFDKMKLYYFSDEELIHFPIMTYDPLLPLEEMKVEELRLYRNLQFARHGYRFKSRDLQEIFGSFEWYSPRPNNNHIVLTEEETQIVNKCLALEKEKKEKISQIGHPCLFSGEDQKSFLVGNWQTPSSYGYTFFSDNTFSYQDTVSDLAKKQYFVSCKGEWKIENNNIYIKQLSYVESYKEDITEHVIPYPAFVKIGELESCKVKTQDTPYSLTLCPIVTFNIMKFKKEEFFLVSKDTTEEKVELNEEEEKDSSKLLRNYLASFFDGEKYKITVFTEYKEPIFFAKRIINKGKDIYDKGSIYTLHDGYVDELLVFTDNKVLSKDNLIYEEISSSLYGWKAKVIESASNIPEIYITSYIDKTTKGCSDVLITVNEKGEFYINNR